MADLTKLTAEELLNCPRIEDGENATQVWLAIGAFTEIQRRLKRLEACERVLKLIATKVPDSC